MGRQTEHKRLKNKNGERDCGCKVREKQKKKSREHEVRASTIYLSLTHRQKKSIKYGDRQRHEMKRTEKELSL